MQSLLGRVGAWPAWAKLAAVVIALMVVAGGAGLALATRHGLGRAANTAEHATAPPTASAVAPSTSASGAPIASTLACRLPISNGQSGGGGFITFPAASFAADPSSDVERQGSQGLSYDRAVGKWVPALRSAVSPDGSRYAYFDFQTESIRSVTIATGAGVSLGPRPNGAASAARVNLNDGWTVIEAVDAGVYARPGEGGYGGGNLQQGLWLFPWSGAGERLVTSTGYWHAIGGGGAWGTVSESVPEGAANTILRLDLSTGTSADWYTVAGLVSQVIGFDAADHPVLQATSKSLTEVWVVSDRNAGTKLLSLTPASTPTAGGPAQPTLQSVVGDGNGTWLATSDGLYLSTAAGTQKVSTVTGQLGGGCAAT